MVTQKQPMSVEDDDAMPSARRDINTELTSMVTQRRFTQHQTPNAAKITNGDLSEPSEESLEH